jgi:hypothetical protein
MSPQKGDGIQVCTVEGCEKTHNAKGMCAMHYMRLKKTGNLDDPKPRPSTSERFWKLVDKSGECWTWTGALNRGGYGNFALGIIEGKRRYDRAHRMSYKLTHGEIPDGMYIDHMCHTKACVRPDHLRAVTNKENLENRAGLTKANTSGVHGVSWSKKRNKWHAYAAHHGQRITVGFYDDLEEAGRAALEKRLELYTHNDIDRRAA